MTIATKKNTALTENKIGVRVKRNPADWKWDDQDFHNGKPGFGTTDIYHGPYNGWISVYWDGGNRNSYRIGHQGKYDLLLVEESETQETTKEKNSMKIPMPTAALIATLKVDLQGERRTAKTGEFYLGESGGEFTMVVCQADRDTSASFWIVQPKQEVFELNATSKVTIPTSPTAKVVVNVSGSSPTTQEHNQTDIKRLAKQLTLPSTFHGNTMNFDSEAKVQIGCQTYLVRRILELAAQLP